METELKRTALCYMLNGRGDIVMRKGRPIRFYVESEVENAVEKLRKRSYQFIEWWD
jgi:hypothetical protein